MPIKTFLVDNTVETELQADQDSIKADAVKSTGRIKNYIDSFKIPADELDGIAGQLLCK